MGKQLGQLERPRGVMIIAILEIIVGSIAILYWGLSISIAITEGMETLLITRFAMEILMGVFYIVIGWGLWSIKHWAYQGAIILAIYGLILAVISLLGGFFPIFPILIHGSVLYYIRRPEIKELFLVAKFRGEPQMDLEYTEIL